MVLRFSAAFALLLLSSGCTPFTDYVRNGFKVGPNYHKPPAPVAKQWIDARDQRLSTETADLSKWWAVFNDPILNNLICDAYHQNLTLRQAGYRVLFARAQRAIAVGELFPQIQTAMGSYTRDAVSTETSSTPAAAAFKRFFQEWTFGFNLAWELDFWGRFRRAVEQATDTLDGAVENYDAALVTLLGDVASAYVQLRTIEKQIEFTRANAELQRQTLVITRARFQGGKGVITELDVDQALSNLAQTEAQIPQLEIQLRQVINQLCILMGIPPEDLAARLGKGSIPVAPETAAVGIPADLLRRRPDVRAAERQAAADSAAIGIAESDFYPHILLNATFSYEAQHFNRLFRPSAFAGSFGPQFTWAILNYGRILNNVRAQVATFQADVANYQNTVLTAAQDVENGIVTFLKAQEEAKFLQQSVDAANRAVTVALAQYQGGTTTFTTLALVEQNLVVQQNLLAQAQGSISLGLIQIYRALGGGWQIRLTDCISSPVQPPAGSSTTPPAAPGSTTPELPAPRPAGPPAPAPPVPSPPRQTFQDASPSARFGAPVGQ
jgi:NodT family efflux transporter outer membrane factor (OMF) lipoprotein